MSYLPKNPFKNSKLDWKGFLNDPDSIQLNKKPRKIKSQNLLSLP